jgi:hypothetical protein
MSALCRISKMLRRILRPFVWTTKFALLFCSRRCHRCDASPHPWRAMTGSQHVGEPPNSQPEYAVEHSGPTFRTLSFTSIVDGLDHVVNDDIPSAKSGFPTALCGHLVQVTALVSPPGPPCRYCTQLINSITVTRKTRPSHRRRGCRLQQPSTQQQNPDRLVPTPRPRWLTAANGLLAALSRTFGSRTRGRI